MNQTVATVSLPRSTEPAPRSPAADRMRRYRKRRRKGHHCFRIVVAETEIDALVEKGFLEQKLQQDPDAIVGAVQDLLCQVLADATLRATAL